MLFILYWSLRPKSFHDEPTSSENQFFYEFVCRPLLDHLLTVKILNIQMFLEGHNELSTDGAVSLPDCPLFGQSRWVYI